MHEIVIYNDHNVIDIYWSAVCNVFNDDVVAVTLQIRLFL